MIKAYYRLAKPGIIYGNLLTALAAYLYASHWHIGWVSFLATMLGLGLVIGSACVFNNYYDWDIDQKMERTKDRALASGAISKQNALAFGIVLGAIGSALLAVFVNVTTTILAAVGFAIYVFAYTFLKRKTEWATEVGSIAGAMPIVAGYTAVTIGWAAPILFLAMVFWQMPHFFAIAMRRADEYAAAGIPVVPLKHGTREAKWRSMLYIIAFAITVAALTFFGLAGFLFSVVTETTIAVWFWQSSRGFRAPDTEIWARGFFFGSLWVLLVFSAMLSVATILP